MAEETARIPTVDIDVAQELLKPRLEAILVADYGAPTTDKKADVCGIFDRMFIRPGIEENVGVFYLFIRTTETMEEGIQITIISPQGKVLGGGLTSPDDMIALKQEPPPRSLQIIQRLAIKLPTVGVYWIDVSYKGESLGRKPFAVDLLKGKE